MIKIDSKGLDQLIKKIGKLKQYLRSQDQRQIDLSQEAIFQNGPFLHQDTELMSKEQSLKIEQDNRKVFASRRSINDQIRGLLE